MKKFFFLTLWGFASVSMLAQEPMEDEILQARMHFMNAAKVSYLASNYSVTASQSSPNQQIPAEIKAAFFAKYKSAQEVQWVIKDDRYKINFELQGKGMFAYLDRRGNWIKSFTKVSQAELPAAIVEYLEVHYQGYQLSKCYLKDTPATVGYTLAVKKDGSYVWLEFDLDGNIQTDLV